MGVRHAGQLQAVGAVADDAGVAHQQVNLPMGETGDDRGVEVGKGLAVAGPTLQDGQPTETGLCAFQGQQFEMLMIGMDRNSPLRIVVGNQPWTDGPWATRCAVGWGVGWGVGCAVGCAVGAREYAHSQNVVRYSRGAEH
jgi:hypothetical protein